MEAGYVPPSLPDSPERVLADYHLAGPFHRDTIIADPTGRLRAVHERVSRDFAPRQLGCTACTRLAA